MVTLVETKEQLVRRFREVQDIVINETVKAIENANQRRQKIQQLWNEYRVEVQKTLKERVIEKLGEKGEQTYVKFRGASHVIGNSGTPRNVDPASVQNVMKEQRKVDELLAAMRTDETSEGRALKAEAEQVKRELEELENVLAIAKGSKGRLLKEEELQGLLTHIHNAQATLAREVSEDSYIRNIEAAENKLAAAIGSLARNMTQLEWKEAAAAKK